MFCANFSFYVHVCFIKPTKNVSRFTDRLCKLEQLLRNVTLVDCLFFVLIYFSISFFVRLIVACC